MSSIDWGMWVAYSYLPPPPPTGPMLDRKFDSLLDFLSFRTWSTSRVVFNMFFRWIVGVYFEFWPDLRKFWCCSGLTNLSFESVVSNKWNAIFAVCVAGSCAQVHSNCDPGHIKRKSAAKEWASSSSGRLPVKHTTRPIGQSETDLHTGYSEQSLVLSRR